VEANRSSQTAEDRSTSRQLEAEALRRHQSDSRRQISGGSSSEKADRSSQTAGVRKQHRKTVGKLVIAAAARRQIEAARLQKADVRWQKADQ
jgi:hypothetical protein